MALASHVAGKRAPRMSHLARYTEVNQDVPRNELPRKSMTATAAADFIRSELRLDGNPNLNLASFVTTQVDRECHDLIEDALNKNLADQDQYPHSAEIQDRCVNILANLWNAPTPPQGDRSQRAVGTATIGSSEAIMLGGLAMKWRWRENWAKSKGIKQTEVTERPNIIFSAACHVSILKLCRFFDIDARVLAVEKDRMVIDTDEVIRQCDERTAGVFLILGTTLTGELDNVEEMNNKLLALKKSKGLDIPIHVDAASGGFVIPFTHPGLKWDFRLEQVRSINTSGHKYGLTYPGLGWIVWKTGNDLPDGLVFHVNYLGVDEPTYSLNFSKSGHTVIAQYYNFLRLGHEGYKQIMDLCVDNAKELVAQLQRLGVFTILSQNDKPSVPLVAFRLTDDAAVGFDATVLVHELKVKGWIVPAYTLPANAADVMVMRVVVRETFTREMVRILVQDLRLILISLTHARGKTKVCEQLSAEAERATAQEGESRRTRQHMQRVRAMVRQKVDAAAAGPTALDGVTSLKQSLHGGDGGRDADKVNEMKSAGAKVEAMGQAAPTGDGSNGPLTVHTIC